MVLASYCCGFVQDVEPAMLYMGSTCTMTKLLLLNCPLAGSVKGVDSTAASEAAIPAAKALAHEYGCIVAVSGATDYVGQGRAMGW